MLITYIYQCIYAMHIFSSSCEWSYLPHLVYMICIICYQQLLLIIIIILSPFLRRSSLVSFNLTLMRNRHGTDGPYWQMQALLFLGQVFWKGIIEPSVIHIKFQDMIDSKRLQVVNDFEPESHYYRRRKGLGGYHWAPHQSLVYWNRVASTGSTHTD